MLKLNKKVDYGIIILAHLVRCREQVVSAADIARQFSLSRPLVANVLKQLSRADLVSSSRGSRGGYQLACEPSKITLGQVVRAIDGEFTLTECTTTGGDGTGHTTCEISPTCPIRQPIQFVHDEVASVLDRLTFDRISAGHAADKAAAVDTDADTTDASAPSTPKSAPPNAATRIRS